MPNWQKIKISKFLKEREGRYKPNDEKIINLKRLEKIDFSGNIYLANKKSKTNMIIIKPGDFIISGINVAKGAMAVYQGKEDITATIHYSTYIFDENKINIEYFKKFLKSPIFISLLEDQVKGGIKTEIKAKQLLGIEIYLPDLESQNNIINKFKKSENELANINSEISIQFTLLNKLRQTILQEAVEGKLTTEWRKINPIQEGNLETDASALLNKIKEEKLRLKVEGKIKKGEKNHLDNDTNKPFDLPKSWCWAKLIDIIHDLPRNGYSPKAVNYQTGIKTLKLGATTYGIFNPSEFKYIDDEIPKDSIYWLEPNDILIQRGNSIDYVGVSAIYTGLSKEFIYPDLMMKIKILPPLSIKLINIFLSSPLIRNYYRENAKGSQKTMPKINQGVVINTPIPLPPLAEQQVIVEKIEKIFFMIDELSKQTEKRKKFSEEIMKAILREAFEIRETEMKNELVKEEKEQKYTPFQLQQIIGAVIINLEKYKMYHGEMVIAKYLYLLSCLYKIKTGFDFTKQNFGPYDSKIRKIINTKTFFYQDGQGNIKYYCVKNKEKLFKYKNKIVDLINNKINELISIFQKYKPQDRGHKIELIATMIKIIEEIKRSDFQSVYEGLKNWLTPHSEYKNKADNFNKKEIEDCLNFIKTKKWDKVIID